MRDLRQATQPSGVSGPGVAPYEPQAEARVALKLALLVLGVLTVVKPLGSIPVLGTVLLTGAALLQLYLPLSRAQHFGRDYDFAGLHLKVWRQDLGVVLKLCALFFPPFIVGHHLYMTEAHVWATSLGLPELARLLPHRAWGPMMPAGILGWLGSAGWLLQVLATHLLGVALPEETFYRGYLQPHLEVWWRPTRHVFGVPIGKAALLAALLFAAGHVLGEWNPLRLGPFFPALVFAWQRNRTGSVVGAVTFHALCNTLGEVLFSLYRTA